MNASSHAAARVSEPPTSAQLKELFSQIDTGRVTKMSMQRFLRGEPAVTVAPKSCHEPCKHDLGPDLKCTKCNEQFVRCGQNGSRCSICGHHFADGDDICSGGGHEYGHLYPASNPHGLRG